MWERRREGEIMNRKRSARAVSMAMLLSLIPMESFGAGWMKSPTPPTAKEISSGWWYATNENNTTWYSAPEGQKTAWFWLDGNQDGIAECYCFNDSGWMYADTVTPDGYTVNKDGAWVINGEVQKKTVPILKKTVTSGGSSSSSRRSGGSSGGSGGSSSGSGGSHISSGTTEEGKEEKPSGSNANESGNDQDSKNENSKKLYHYTINYMDQDSKEYLKTEIGIAEEGAVVQKELPEFEGYQVCPDQKIEFQLERDGVEKNIYYTKIRQATPTEAEPEQEMISWVIHFVDQGDHTVEVWPLQSGEIVDGGELSINFPETIRREENQIWTSIEASPFVRNIYGPGNYIEYIEFVGQKETPEADPDQEEKNQYARYLDLARENESEITGEDPEKIPDSRFLVTDQTSNDYRVRSISTQINDQDEHCFYVIGKNFVPNGITVAEWFGEEAVYSNLLETEIQIGQDTYYVSKMGIQRKISADNCGHLWEVEGEQEASCSEKGKAFYQCSLCGEEKVVTLPPLGHIDQDQDQICDRCGESMDSSISSIHWKVGDVQAREIDGKIYMFRCIDQNYSDADANHRQAALFLCETVIPANYGSDYKVKQQADGSHKYEFVPGPIVNYGNGNDYKYSAIRKWLNGSKEQFRDAESVNIGVSYAYMGSTGDQEYADFDANSLVAYYIGNQQLKEPLFILSVDEAVKYKDSLWKFDGSEEDNPETQYTPFSKGYWLRSPMGNAQNYDTGYVYVVDLVNGSIHPASIKPLESTGNDELDVTTTYGIRPAFIMKQD